MMNAWPAPGLESLPNSWKQDNSYNIFDWCPSANPGILDSMFRMVVINDVQVMPMEFESATWIALKYNMWKSLFVDW